ncbi:tethering complex subunit, partial [Coemansia sp. RSA 486]
WDHMKPLSKFKNMEVTAVAWNGMAWSTGKSSTKTVLFGTHDGKIYETELKPGNDAKSKRSDIPAKLVAELPVRERVTGLSMEAFPERKKQHLVLIATGTRLYQVIGAAELESRSSGDKGAVFEMMLKDGLTSPNYQEIPGMPGPGALSVYHRKVQTNGQSHVLATDFAWLTSMGVFFGGLTFATQESGDSVVKNASLLPYPLSSSQQSASGANGADTNGDNSSVEQPVSLAITEFHILLQYSNCIRAMSMLNSKLVFESHVSSGQPGAELFQGLTVDETKRTCWLFSPLNIYELVVTDEDRDVWDIYLSRRQFDSALKHCYNDSQRDIVLRAQAEHLFADGQFEKSAECFARTSISFEEAALRFVDMKNNRVLKSYLQTKLTTLRKQDRIQNTLLVMWLIEIYLCMLGSVDAKIASAGATDTNSSSSPSPSPNSVVQFELEKEMLLKELYALVAEYKASVDPATTYQLAESHGRRDFWLHYAFLREDYERVVGYWMEKENYIQAIKVLGHYGTPEMFYKYSPALMSAEPSEL